MATKRVPLKGSCHCQKTRFVVFLDLPHTPDGPDSHGKHRQRIYRCNCTICHKLGHLHVRPKNPGDNFFLLAPLNPLEELGDYRCNEMRSHWLFCKTCGVTPFIFRSDGEQGEVHEMKQSDLGLATGEEGEKVVKVWRPIGGSGIYCSINGHAIDAEQPDFDMRELKEKGLLQYLDTYVEGDDREPNNYERPCKNGSY